MNVQWYPGHMTKARRQMEEDQRLIDLVIELVDARVPQSSRNPDIDEMGKNKSRLIILNKSDLADEKKNTHPAGNKPGARGRRRGGPAAMMPGEKARDFSGTMRTLLGYLRPYRVRLVIILICAVASTLFNIVSPAILGAAQSPVAGALALAVGAVLSWRGKSLLTVAAACCAAAFLAELILFPIV